MKQWVKKLLSQFEPDRSNPANLEEIAKHISEERATLLHIVDMYNKHLFEVDKWPHRKVREILDEFSRQLINIQNPNNEKLLFRLRQFFSTYRIDETSFVQKTFDDFKGIIWDFADQLGEDIRFEQDKDVEVQKSLVQLREAVESESIEDLRSKSREFIDFYVSYQAIKDERRNERMSTIQKNLGHMKKRLAEAQEDVRKDHLTGAFNRKSFEEKLTASKNSFDSSGAVSSLLFLDIDHFKKINDTYGHDVGDVVLKELVKMLKNLQPGASHFVARTGGEEFGIVLPDMGIKKAIELADIALNKIRNERVHAGQHDINFTISIGVSQLLKDETVEEWLKRTDIALYESKHNGRDRYSLAYDPNNFNSAA
ncbi:MAG: GGDEF domain-containing protein [Bdellovibrionota bacterium]